MPEPYTERVYIPFGGDYFLKCCGLNIYLSLLLGPTDIVGTLGGGFLDPEPQKGRGIYTYGSN